MDSDETGSGGLNVQSENQENLSEAKLLDKKLFKPVNSKSNLEHSGSC